MEQETENKSSSVKYFVIGFVVLLVVIGAGYFLTKSSGTNNAVSEAAQIPTAQPAGSPSLTGQKLSDTQFSSNAVLIAPGTLSEGAKAATAGWQIKSKSLSDGTIQVDLIPVGSEATEGDTRHSFNLKSGGQLYFVDLNPGDDSSGADNNKNDDIGIVVDENGIIQ